MAGRPLGSLSDPKYLSQLQDTVRKHYTYLTIVSEAARQENGHRAFLVKCETCGVESTKDYFSLKSGKAGCRTCYKPRQAPKWLVARCISAKQRCTNPNDRRFADY